MADQHPAPWRWERPDETYADTYMILRDANGAVVLFAGDNVVAPGVTVPVPAARAVIAAAPDMERFIRRLCDGTTCGWCGALPHAQGCTPGNLLARIDETRKAGG